MRYMSIGSSGIEASVITLGAWSIGGGSWWKNTEDELSIQTIRLARELGINTIDSAPIYGCGHSEEIIGIAIAGHRDEYVLSTKATFDWDTGVGRYWGDVDGHKIYVDHSYEGIIKDCDNSLKRLGTDYIDIFYAHNPAKDTETYPVEDTVRAFMDLKKAGKIRAFGLSNATTEQIEAYLACGCKIDILQRKYSMLTRGIEDDILPFAREHGMSVHAYSPLERGILAGTVAADFEVPPGDARDGEPWWKPERLPKAVAFVQGLSDICEQYECTPAQLAIAYLRASDPCVNVLCGAHKPHQIEADVPAADIDLSAETVAEIRRRLLALDAACAQ